MNTAYTDMQQLQRQKFSCGWYASVERGPTIYASSTESLNAH